MMIDTCLPLLFAAAETAESEAIDWMNVLLTAIVVPAIVVYVFKLWLEDYQANLSGNPNPKALPGAYPATRPTIIIGVAGALVLLGLETAGEYALGISDEQKTLGWLMILPLIAAGFGEELIFRGFLIVDKKGKAALVGSAIGFSLLFALLHPFLWNFEDGDATKTLFGSGIVFDFSAKAWFSTASIFVNSLFFYWLRFMPANPSHSLVPCIVAHVVTNVGVFLVKMAQGHIGGLI